MIPEICTQFFKNNSRILGIGFFLMISVILFAVGISAFEQRDIIPFYTDPDDNKNSVPPGSDSLITAPNADNQNTDASTQYSLKDKDSKYDNNFVFGGGHYQSFGGNQLGGPGGPHNSEEEDYDDDGVKDDVDNCPTISNNNQMNGDEDEQGDACDSDGDNDEIPDDRDNCPTISNNKQMNGDEDEQGDACEDNDTSIPEFPTIAFPVIATIGLLFVLHRKKMR